MTPNPARRDDLNLMLKLLQAAEHLAARLPTSIPVHDQISDTIAEVEFLQVLIDADPALFEPWTDG